MSKHKPEIEWQILYEQREGRHTAALPDLTSEMSTSNQRAYQLYAYAACLILLLLLGGAWLWYQAQAGVEQIESEVQDAVKTELWVAANYDVELAIDQAADPMAPAWHRQFARDDNTLSALQASAADSSLDVDLHLVELENDWAKVQLTVGGAGDNIDYRQTRFYRKTVDGWLRTAPSAERWGTSGSLESDYFVFYFRQHDAEVVAEVAPQLDALHTTLRHNLGLAINTGGAKLVIEISPTELPGAALLGAALLGAALLGSAPLERFVVPSPSLYLAPVNVTDSELILQSLVLLLVPNALDEAITSNNIYWMHELMLHALHLWLLWDLELPLASWRDEIVQWRLTDVQAANQGEAAPLPLHYPEFCALHSGWLSSPTLLSIPLTCDERDHAPMYAPPPEAVSTAQLEQLTANIFRQVSSPMDAMQATVQPGDAVILTTLVEYVVNHYGRGQVPVLLAALGEHKSWTTLSQAVFGVSSAKFADGWQRYLIKHYGLDTER